MPYGILAEHRVIDSPTCAQFAEWLHATRKLQLPQVALVHDPHLSRVERQRNSLKQPWYRIVDETTGRGVGVLFLSLDTDGTYAGLNTHKHTEKPGLNTATVGNIETEDPYCKGAGRAALCLAFEMLHTSGRPTFAHLFTPAGYKVCRELIAAGILDVETPITQRDNGLFQGYAVYKAPSDGVVTGQATHVLPTTASCQKHIR